MGRCHYRPLRMATATARRADAGGSKFTRPLKLPSGNESRRLVVRCWSGAGAGTCDGDQKRNNARPQPSALSADQGLRNPPQNPPGARAGNRARCLAAGVAPEQRNDNREDDGGRSNHVEREEGEGDDEKDEGQALEGLSLEQERRGNCVLEFTFERSVRGVWCACEQDGGVEGRGRGGREREACSGRVDE